MSELIAARDVAGSVDVPYICAKASVDRDAFLGVRHAGLFEIQIRDSRLPSGSNQKEIAANLLAVGRYYDFVVFFAHRFCPTPHKSDSFALENAAHHFA